MKRRSLICLAALLGACGRAPSPEPHASGAPPPSAGLPAPASTASAPPDAAQRCQAEVDRLMAEPALPGAPGFEARRHETLARAKAVPVLFTRAPAIDDGATKEAQIYRLMLTKTASPAWQLSLIARYLHNRQELARAVFLREGYLYAESPAVASAITEFVDLGDLFRAPDVVIQRGSQLLHATRKKLGYEYVDGPEKGQRAKLILLDRVWEAGKEPGALLHRDVRALAERQGFDRLRIKRLTERGAVAELRYGDVWVTAALGGPDVAFDSACEVVPEAERERVEAARDVAHRRARLLSAERAAIDAMVAEALPFDEPKTEDGQQDGTLRPAWLWAYRHGWDSYEFNDDGYSVFDAKGRPFVPEVCIDFVTDTLERASGTWFRARAATRETTRERVIGRLNFDDLGIPNRRSVEVFVDFAWSHPESFEVVDLPPEERIPLWQHEPFFAHLRDHADRYRPGDIVTIHGLRSDGKLHYHSFIVYDADPVTGTPTLLASNAGHPRVRTWEQELRVAPRRSIRTRVRPRLEWLESVIVPAGAVSSEHAVKETGTEPT